jgi:hypothetical protein
LTKKKLAGGDLSHRRFEPIITVNRIMYPAALPGPMKQAKAKREAWIANGVKIGWLIDVDSISHATL